MPPNDILINYERIFATPHRHLQDLRMQALARQADAHFLEETRVVPDEGMLPPSADGEGPRMRPRWSVGRLLERRWIRMSLTAGTCAVVVAVSFAAGRGGSHFGDLLWSSGATTQHVSDKSLQYDHEPMDGDDPRARGCDFDATALQSVPLLLPGGAAWGQLRLRHSAQCGTDWGSALYTNPNMYTVYIEAIRPKDGAKVRSQWSNNTPPGSYGDMLSTGTGCVSITAWVVTPTGTGPRAATSCLR